MMLSQFIGNSAAVKALSISIKAAKKKNDRLEHLLLSGPAGIGKTYLSKLIAEESNSVYAYINGTMISNMGDLVQVLNEAIREFNIKNMRRIIVAVDEAHALKNSVVDGILTIISEDLVPIKEGKRIVNYPILREESGRNDYMSWIFCTNRAGELPRALLSRVEEIRLLDYSIEEKREIAGRYIEEQDHYYEEEVTEQIATRSYTARDVKNYVKGLCNYAIGTDRETLTKEVGIEYFDLIMVDEQGLGESERRYLSILYDNPNGISVQNIAAHMGVSSKDITEIIERKVVMLGLVNISSSGRAPANTDKIRNVFKIKEG